ncbi:hypothetical protein AB1K62_13900 [Parasphingorhabdus sp. JC815]|uniref:hypothetical protein n=1 Tax=Parasphingorhabdus sp. JC815 TaxID=3232140 RepID=UPI00345A1557
MFLDEHNMAAQVNDIYHDDAKEDAKSVSSPEDHGITAKHESRTFGLPRSVWSIMMTCYAIFFGALAVAMGHDGGAIFVLVVSGLFALMYFGTGFVLNSIGAASRKNQKSEWVEGKFQTQSGPMSFGAIFGQMLILPILFAIFGIAMIIIRHVVI